MSSSSLASRSSARIRTRTPICMTRGSKVASPCRTHPLRRVAWAKAVVGLPAPRLCLRAPSSATFAGVEDLAPLTGVKPKSLTRAQKLAKALRACGKRAKKKRAGCKRGRGRDMASRSGSPGPPEAMIVSGAGGFLSSGCCGVSDDMHGLCACRPRLGERSLRGGKLCQLDRERAKRVTARTPGWLAPVRDDDGDHLRPRRDGADRTGHARSHLRRSEGHRGELAPGLIVNPRATETRCTEAELESRRAGRLPNAAAVGVFSIYLGGIEVLDEPVYNMAPPAGVPAELGFNAAGIGADHARRGQAAHRRRLRPVGGYLGHLSGTPDLRPRAHAVGQSIGREPRRRTRPVCR